MIVTELVFLLILPIINAISNRCYLCSQETLPECVGSNHTDLSTILQYYTEPCNGQCVLFRNKNHSLIRGCSWTYGHMQRKSIGWHEITPGIKAYFCNRYLCNNGTYDRPEISKFLFSPEQLYLLATNNPSQIQFDLSRQLHQCYSCTARFQGCGEFLDPHYASKYIRPCPSSCILFRNPNDLNLITRDCGMFWPQVHAKSGFHKLLGSDAFFCQESLCNGISFDFIMGMFHHQLPAVIKFPPIKNISITTTTVYDDSDFDDFFNESTTLIISNTSVDLINTTFIDDLSTINDTIFLSSTSTMILSTKNIDEDNWNTSSIVPITRFEHLSGNDNQTDHDILPSTTPIIDFFTFFPYYLLNNQTKNHFFQYIKPISTLAIPPFSWMLHMAAQNKSLFQNSTTSTTTTTIKTPNTFYEYCKDKTCHHGGRLNSDCLCICLPTFTGDNCETVLCDEEPTDICAFILEHECEINYMRYLCPKFCQIDLCI